MNNETNNQTTKICSQCKIEKEIINFKKDRNSKNGLRSNCKECDKIYRDNNLERSRKLYISYYNNRMKIDSLFKFKKQIRNLIRDALTIKVNRNYTKETKSKSILGCTSYQLKEHFQNLFEPWMNWDNRGLYNGQKNYGWDIDHIIPMSTAKTIEDVIKLNHYTNLRPRCSYLNRVHDKIK
jgi:hypothetical protein